MSELIRFIESHCPKFNKVCQIMQGDCGVSKGRRCLCFEEALPNPRHEYLPDGFDYKKIEVEYLPMAKARTWFLTRGQYESWRRHGWGSLFSSVVTIPEKIESHWIEPTKSRTCDCGEPLGDSQRVCDKCKIECKRKTKRRAMRKYREQKAEPAFENPKQVRQCQCGKPLQPRRRFCDKCRDRSQKWSNVQRQRNYRKNQRV